MKIEEVKKKVLHLTKSSIRDLNNILEEKQLAAFVEHGFGAEEPVNLFGFSMGGLIHRVYLQEMEGWRRVRKFVTTR